MHPDQRRRNRMVRATLGTALALALVGLLASRTAEGPYTVEAAPSATDVAPTSTSTTLYAHRRHSGPILVLGDSLAVGADSAGGLSKLLRADGWTPTINAEVGRSTRTGISIAQGMRSVPPLVIVELGTNPSSAISTFPSEVDNLVDVLHARGAQRIAWVTPVHHDDDRYDDKVRAIEAKAAEDPTVVVVDWASIAKANLKWFNADGLHYGQPGLTALAQLLADTADRQDPA